MKYATMMDIAKALGISKSTVSRALSGDNKNVNKDTLKKILYTAHEMGYKKNELAVNLRMKSTRTIGIVVPEMTTPFYMNFISSAQSKLNEQGYRVILALSNESPNAERINLLMFEDYRVEGVIISACHNKANLEIYQDFLKQKIPLVFFDRTITTLPVPKIKIDDYIQSCFMVEHLIRLGCKRIVHIAGPHYIQNAIERKKGYKDTMEKFHLYANKSLIIVAGVSVEDGAEAVETLLSMKVEFDAIFCFTEMQALGAKRSLQEHDIKIPNDVAISCMSGTSLSTLVHPSLTAVEQPVEKMAETAVVQIIEQINNFSLKDETIILNSEMFIRNSSKK